MSKGKKIVIGIICALFVLTLGIYLGGVWYFSSHFLPGSALNGRNCSFQTEQDAQTMIAESIATYQLTIDELDGVQEKMDAQDIKLKYVEDDSVRKMLNQQEKWKWFLSVASPKKYTMSASTTYSEKKLKEAIENLNCFKKMIEPVDAHIEEKDGIYYIVPEVVGNKLDQNKVTEVITEAIENGERQVSLVDTSCYLKPSVYQDDEALKKEVEELNRYTQVTIYYDFGDREETVDGDLIRTWLVKAEDGSYMLDEAAMKDYVYQLAYKYDTFGGTREFVTATGQKITIKGGDYGYVIKQDQTLQELKDAILNGKSGTREPVYLYKGACRDTNDIGDTYVEIDLTNQKMYFYKDGSLLVETEVVTGNPNKGNATPTGCYALDNKKSPAVLKGEDYASDVTYWMPFNKNVGIHDCGTWRTEFGGKIYLTNGSHGCVNTPFKAAETIYNNIEIGMPIIVY